MSPCNPDLVHAQRGGIVESFHRGAIAIAIVDGDGKLVQSLGDIAQPIFPRSACKLLQALPLMARGAAEAFGLTDAELALACASHGGEPGTRHRDNRRAGSPCVSSLLTHDGAPFTDSMLAEVLTLLAGKTDKRFVFVDACFSGGAVAPTRGSGLTAKYFAKTGVDSQCGIPSNIVTRGLEATGAQRWKHRDNVIYLTAARDTEIAFEEAGAGGFATRAYRDCALGEARDLDGSANLSVDEIRQCAQQRIDRWLAPSREYTAPHLTLFGNRDFVPTLAPVVASAPGPVAAATAAQVHPERTLRDIYSQRDDRRVVSVRLSRKVLEVGRDALAFTVTSTHPGCLHLLYAGPDGRSFDLLFPNRLDTDNFLPSQRALRLPRQGWTLQSRGPPGTNRLLAIMADAPRDFSRLGWRPAGVYSSLAATPGAAREMALTATTPMATGTVDCRPDAARPDTPQRCGDGFGAALVDVQEVR